MGRLASVRARLRLLFARGSAETRMEEEIRFHLEMEAARLEREEGLDPAEARRRAHVAFGGVERTKEELREGRGLAWLSGLRLDLKLGARMLLKYPMLTAASVLTLAVAVALAASWFEFMTDVIRPTLPLPEGDRIVTIRTRDLEAGANRVASLRELETWREGVRSVAEVSGATPVSLSVSTEDDRLVTLEGVRVTASLLGLTRTRPILGRTLTERDFEGDAPLVVVLGHSAWQRLFDGAPSAVGATLRLGTQLATVVGVMPEGFGFPVNEEIWTPLRETAVRYGPRDGPPLMVFGRLAPGATLEEARAELALVGERTAAAYPATHERLRPRVDRFGRGSDMALPAALLNVPFLLFLLVVCANVATLLFARTATRESELALRSALGASRRRILLQLVAEALVLTSAAAALGLAAAHKGLGRGMELFWQVQQTRPPFWFDPGLSLTTVLYVAALTLLGALVIGGLPGLRATRRRIRHRLAQPGAGGSGMRFGAIATGVIVAQVALCVAFIPFAIMNGRGLLPEHRDSDFPADAYLSGRLTRQVDLLGTGAALEEAGSEPDRGTDAPDTTALFDEVRRRLAAEPGVIAATRASRIPGFNHPVANIEIEGDPTLGYGRRLAVDPDFFEVMGARIAAGRPFRPGDAASADAAAIAIADQAWAREAFRGRNPVGRRIRYPGPSDEEPGPWYEIVGVVAGMERAVGPGEPVALYHPLRAGELSSVQLYLRTDGPPAAIAPRVQAAATAVDARIGLADLAPLAEIWRPVQRSNVFFIVALGVVAAIILMFALIGIYALMSFTVARRAREIGIRAALGADPRRIVVAIFSRAAAQIGLGIAAGGALVSFTIFRSPAEIRLVAAVAAAMLVVGLLGCVVPARRALRVQPTEALRAE